MRKASLKREYAVANRSFAILDVIIEEIDSICASPRDKRAELLMGYRGRLYELRAQYKMESNYYKLKLNIED